jgi:nitrogen fixation/metabolism regulation signal transduction histidine kinase
MPIKIGEITKGESVNAIGNIVFAYDIVDDKGIVIASEASTISVNYDNIDMKSIASDLIKNAQAKEYEALQKAKADKFDTIALKAEIEKQLLDIEVSGRGLSVTGVNDYVEIKDIEAVT